MKKIVTMVLLFFFAVPILSFAEDKLWFESNENSPYKFAYFYKENSKLIINRIPESKNTASIISLDVSFASFDNCIIFSKSQLAINQEIPQDVEFLKISYNDVILIFNEIKMIKEANKCQDSIIKVYTDNTKKLKTDVTYSQPQNKKGGESHSGGGSGR